MNLANSFSIYYHLFYVLYVSLYFYIKVWKKNPAIMIFMHICIFYTYTYIYFIFIFLCISSQLKLLAV